MDRFDLSAHGEPVSLFRRAGLSAALVIGVQTDLLFSVTEQQGNRDHRSRPQGSRRALPRFHASRGTTPSSWTLDTFGREIGAFLRSV